MLQQFTWQQFLVATLVLTIVWYIGVILIYYPKQLKSLLNGKSTPDEVDRPLDHKWDKSVDVLSDNDEPELMGKSKLPEGMSKVSIDEVSFVSDDEKEERLGVVSDVLEEIKIIFGILAKEDGNKHDFLNLISAIRENYPGIASNPNLHRINEFIIDHASFHITSKELDDIWY